MTSEGLRVCHSELPEGFPRSQALRYKALDRESVILRPRDGNGRDDDGTSSA